jgi:hypothetical protein
MPWLLWGFERQTHRERELIVIDSSPVPWSCSRANVRVIPAPPGSNVPVKRNLALNAARGTFVAWFDDDDWQHPERLERLVEAIRDDHAIAGSCQSWFLDLFTEAARPYDGRGSLIFNTALYRTELARSVRFDEGCHRASDTPWLRAVRGQHRNREIQLRDDGLTLWLCHDQNISNPRHKRRFVTPLAELKERIGEQAWADTNVQLTQLRERLPSSIAPPLRHENADPHGAPTRNPWAARRHETRRPLEPLDDLRPLPIPAVIATTPTKLPGKSLEIALPGLDQIHPFVLAAPRNQEVVARLTEHWQRQLQLPWNEPTVVVVERQDHEVEQLAEAVNHCAAEFLLVLRPQVLFLGTGAGWLLEGQRRLRQAPEVVQITAHPGKPQGPLGTSRSMASNGRLGWDGRLSAFRWRKPPETYFLLRRTWLATLLAQTTQPELRSAIAEHFTNSDALALALPTAGSSALELTETLDASQLLWLERAEAARLPKQFFGQAFVELPRTPTVPCPPRTSLVTTVATIMTV